MHRSGIGLPDIRVWKTRWHANDPDEFADVVSDLDGIGLRFHRASSGK
jgi:hypothetical protein